MRMASGRSPHISIHAPREGGDPDTRPLTMAAIIISIHAPREGGDLVGLCCANGHGTFQSTPPARGATRIPCTNNRSISISIHAPREGGDFDQQESEL